ncbi:hypothetical protein LPJ61_001491 [Coemansia biformis]|uniref:Ubiquitin-like protease family profile domain-containing protein n=1 Tax=Coemansia biformis TaxID=1286918 RepID=A0A9W7YGL7_9FUNG|nr:hypothetical protein LPJ61_001491 [Coemansia biformis]
MQEPLLFTYHGASVYSSDPPSLHEGSWVKDAILAFYFEYLTHEILKGDDTVLLLKPSLVQLLRLQPGDESLSSALPPGTHKKIIVFIPISNGDVRTGSGSHWSLLVLCRHGDTPAFHYFDSKANANYAHALATKERMDQVLLGGMQTHMHTHSCPQQENGFDCGIFLILFIDILVRRYADLRLPVAAEGKPLPPARISQDRQKRTSQDRSIRTSQDRSIRTSQDRSTRTLQDRPRSLNRKNPTPRPTPGAQLHRHQHHGHSHGRHHHHHHHHHTALGRVHCHSHSLRQQPQQQPIQPPMQHPYFIGIPYFPRYLRRTADSTGADPDGVVRRPVSPFIQSGTEGKTLCSVFRPDMLRAPEISHTFWWIDYGDLCNPNMARQMLLALVNQHTNQYADVPQ